MIENILKLDKEYLWSPGVKQDYGIINDIGEVVGMLSITRFTIEKPFETNWMYINNVKIPKLSDRGRGYAYRAMLEVNKLIESEEANGVLKNSILESKKKDFYQKLGWGKHEGISGPWEFFMTKPVSTFYAKNVVENIVRKNFVK